MKCGFQHGTRNCMAFPGVCAHVLLRAVCVLAYLGKVSLCPTYLKSSVTDYLRNLSL